MFPALSKKKNAFLKDMYLEEEKVLIIVMKSHREKHIRHNNAAKRLFSLLFTINSVV